MRVIHNFEEYDRAQVARSEDKRPQDCPVCPARRGAPCTSPATGEQVETHRGRYV